MCWQGQLTCRTFAAMHTVSVMVMQPLATHQSVLTAFTAVTGLRKAGGCEIACILLRAAPV